MNSPTTASPQADFRSWQARRQAELSASDSWLGVIGLFWLEPGKNAVGQGEGCAVALPDGPPYLGDLVVGGDDVAWMVAPGIELAVDNPGGQSPGGGVLLRTDADGQPSKIDFGSLSFSVMEREGRLAVRLRDRDWAQRRTFAGLDCYEYDPAWRIPAELQALSPPLELEVPSVTGDLKRVTVSHRAVFCVDGKEYSLLPLEAGEENAFFVFRDATSGKESYGGGRFLRAEATGEGRLLLDFNRAYNPPCAFTPFATCPLPPPENWLNFPVRAGEKKYTGAY